MLDSTPEMGVSLDTQPGEQPDPVGVVLAERVLRGKADRRHDATDRPLDAASTLRTWLARQPEDASLRVETIERYERAGRLDIALELARDGVRLDPKSGPARLTLGMVQHAAGNDRAGLLALRHAQTLMRRPDEKANVSTLIGALRARAPDSLRALFYADSLANEVPAPADTARPHPSR